MIAGTTRQPDLVVRLTSSDVRTFDGPGLAGSTGLNWEVRPTGIGGRDGTGFKTGRVVSAGVNQTQRAVLDSLEGGPTSGPELADELGISRSAVWNGVETLREAGFEIGSSEEGYVLTAIPEHGAGAVEHRLEGEFTVEYHDSIPSTNARAAGPGVGFAAGGDLDEHPAATGLAAGAGTVAHARRGRRDRPSSG
jgi:biotin operon repressor BirA-like protein